MDKDKQIAVILKALAYTENGGEPKQIKAGKSGEMKSIFQFTPETWKLYSKQALGQEVPLTPEAEVEVVHKKVSDWVDHGFTTEQIASMWNAGERRPDAYKEGHKGTNKFGVNYDTPAYAKKVASYVKQFENEPGPDEEPTAQLPKAPAPIQTPPLTPTQPPTGNIQGIIKAPNVSTM